MEKLKTLKDIRTKLPKNEYSEELDYFISCKMLRKEAIKWIKYYRKQKRAYDSIREDVLKQFFNITVEELK